MTGRRLTAAVGVIAAAVALLAGAVQLQAARERAYPAADNDVEAMYLRSGEAMRRLTGAYAALAADGYWIRAIQTLRSHQAAAAGTARVPEPPPMLAVPTSSDYSLLYPALGRRRGVVPRFRHGRRAGPGHPVDAAPAGDGVLARRRTLPGRDAAHALGARGACGTRPREPRARSPGAPRLRAERIAGGDRARAGPDGARARRGPPRRAPAGLARAGRQGARAGAGHRRAARSRAAAGGADRPVRGRAPDARHHRARRSPRRLLRDAEAARAHAAACSRASSASPAYVPGRAFRSRCGAWASSSGCCTA